MANRLVSTVHDYVGAAPATNVVPCPHEGDGARLDVSSHGLFVASIIKDIAPNADVHVYRVLGDDGLGDLQTLAQAVLDAISNANQRPLLLNLSLGFGPQLTLLDKLLTVKKLSKGDLKAWQKAIKDAKPPKDPTAELDELLAKNIVRPVGPRYNFLRGLDIIAHNFARIGANTNSLAIAAAGNDSRERQYPFGPRVPAAMEGVVGVSSYLPVGGIAWNRAHYSNNDDLFPNNEGVGAYGGQVATDKHGVTMTTTGLIGQYASATIPAYMPGKAPASPSAIPPVANTTGYAMWSGSSFAAPIAAGFAACLWSEQPAVQAKQIFAWVTQYPVTPRHPAGANRPSLPFQQI